MFIKLLKMKPTLLILAAGMGMIRRIKIKIDGIGPNDEPIIEYSIYDSNKMWIWEDCFCNKKRV